MIGDVIFYIVIFVILIDGLLSLIAPDKVIAFRRKRNWPESFLSGGAFYSSKARARWTGGALFVVALLAILIRHFGE